VWTALLQGGMLSSLVERLCGETTAVHRTVVWYRAVIVNLVCGLVSVVALGVSFYGTVRLSLYLETVARATAASSLLHGLTGLAVASFVVSMIGVYVSYVLYARYGELAGGGLRPFAVAYVSCAACVALTIGTAVFVVSALLLPHLSQTRVRQPPLAAFAFSRTFVGRLKARLSCRKATERYATQANARRRARHPHTGSGAARRVRCLALRSVALHRVPV